MLFALNRIIPPKEWYHDPFLRNKDGETVAIRLAFREIIPPKEWRHDPDL